MQIHDHFDGSAHCIECGGECRLNGDELNVTSLIRHILEHAALLSDNAWLSTSVELSIVEITGKEKFADLKVRAIAWKKEFTELCKRSRTNENPNPHQ